MYGGVASLGPRSIEGAMTQLPDRFAEVLDRHVIAHLATLNRDGSPQVSPIWIEREGNGLRFGTAEGRTKLANLRRDPRLAVSFTHPERSTTAFSIWGRAIAIQARGWDLIDRLAANYDGTDGFPRIPGMNRVDIDVSVEGFHSSR